VTKFNNYDYGFSFKQIPPLENLDIVYTQTNNVSAARLKYSSLQRLILTREKIKTVIRPCGFGTCA